MTTNDNVQFEPNWDSLKQYQIPQWDQDAKLGIFIHWGIYSVPAYDNEWYSRNMYLPESHVSDYHRKTWSDQTQFGYKDFIPLFKSEHFDPQAWQTDTSLSHKSWCYLQDDHFKSLTTITHNLADIVSKNGNLLINVGPKADGTIPDEAQSLLLGLGDWLAVNQEAIYGSRAWHVYGEGTTIQPESHMQEKQDKPFTAQDIRFTRNNGALYAISLGVPETNLTIRSLGHGSQLDANQIDHIEMLGSSAALE